MRVIRVNRDEERRQRLLEARRRHLLFEAKKKKRMKEADYPTEPEKRGYGKAKEITGKYGNVGDMSDAKPNRKVVPALGEGKRRSLAERRARINEMRQRRIRLEAKARRLHESAREEDIQREVRPTREERFLEWLERRERRKLMEARKAIYEAKKGEEEEEPMEECNECGEEAPRSLRRPLGRRSRMPKEEGVLDAVGTLVKAPVDAAKQVVGGGAKTEARRLREARLRLIRKSLAEARARREAALTESAEDAVDTLEPSEPTNPVKGDDLQDVKDGLEKASDLEGPDAPHQEEKAKEVKDGTKALIEEPGEKDAVVESKRNVKQGLKESQAYLNRKARLQKYLKEHAQ